MTPVELQQGTHKKILIAEHSGFCYGVKMAVDTAFDLAMNTPKDKPVYILGELIHNPQVIEKLKQQGVHTVNSVDDIPPGSVCLIRTHGVAPESIDSAESQGIDVSDATCPDVKRVQDRAIQLAEEGYTVIVVGKETHPEVVGIMAHTQRIEGAKIYSVNSPDDLVRVLSGSIKNKVGIVSQTTQLDDNFAQVVAKAAQMTKELRVFNTICTATFKRQTAAEQLAHQVELMVVVGGKNSSNTTHLAEVCRAQGTPAIHVETVEELKEHVAAIEQAQTIGLTAGASTPDWLVEEVLQYLESFQSPLPSDEKVPLFSTSP